LLLAGSYARTIGVDMWMRWNVQLECTAGMNNVMRQPEHRDETAKMGQQGQPEWDNRDETVGRTTELLQRLL
jgi:hypothetical protein